MKRLLLTCICLVSVIVVSATHIIGGEISYEHQGGDTYLIRLVVYRDCGPDNINNTGFDNPAPIGIYENGLLIQNLQIFTTNAVIQELSIEVDNPCLAIPAELCVEEAVYTAEVDLPLSIHGYDLVYQRCCRSPAIVNLLNPDDQGATYYAQIPPTPLISEESNNSSPKFQNLPPAILCVGEPFWMDHSAVDPDSDQLVYSFCDPYIGASFFAPSPSPPPPPPFTNVTWDGIYNAGYPLDADPAFTIDPNTGEITGTPTQAGKYVVGICVEEYRDGELLSTVNRDIMINVVLCAPVTVSSFPEQENGCEGNVIEFFNNSLNADYYHWDFGIEDDESDTTSVFEPTYTYPDTGFYEVTLIANPGYECADTSILTFSIFEPIDVSFEVPEPYCLSGGRAFDFECEATFTGDADFLWDFGPVSVPATSDLQNPPPAVMTGAGTFDVSVTLFNHGCEVTHTESIFVEEFPMAEIAGQTDFCDGLTLLFAHDSQNAELFYWNFGDPAVSGGGTGYGDNPTWTFSDYGEYEVTLIADPGSECADTTIQVVQVLPDDPIAMEYTIYEGNPCDPANGMDVNLNFTGLGGTSAQWDMGDGTELDGLDIVYTYEETGIYEIFLTVYNEFCDHYETATFQVVFQGEAIKRDIDMPNVITPNDDGLNDVLRPYFVSTGPMDVIANERDPFNYIDNYRLLVYNRWGRLMHDSEGDTPSWDGKVDGEYVEEGTYYYIVEYSHQCSDEIQSFDGSFTVLTK